MVRSRTQRQALADVATKTKVRATLSGDDPTAFAGEIAALDPAVDSTTRTVRLRASLPNPDERLRPGMFLNVAVVLPRQRKVIAVPATAVVHASYGDSVFVVEDRKDPSGAPVLLPDGKPAKVVRQQFVRVGAARGDFLAISDGVQLRQELVTSGAFKLRNGMGIAIHHEVQPSYSLVPHPGNR